MKGSSWLLGGGLFGDGPEKSTDDTDTDEGEDVADKGFGWLPGADEDDEDPVDPAASGVEDPEDDEDDKGKKGKKKGKKKPSKRPEPRKMRPGRSRLPSDAPSPSLSPLGTAVVGTAAGALVFRSFDLPGGVILGSLLGGAIGYFGSSFLVNSEDA
jgi:hypothetical protein